MRNRSQGVIAPRLGAYVPRLSTQWLASPTGDETHRELDGALVFVDISGFTAMSERLARQGKAGAEEVTDVLDRVFQHLLDLAYADGGSLLKFGGDALLVLFEGHDHIRRAVHAAGAMRAGIRSAGRIQTSAGVIRLRMSVGVHAGRFQCFLVGGSHRELIVAGPDVSTVVAMESAASAGQVLMSPATAAALPARCLGAEIGGGRLLLRAPPDPGFSLRPAEPIDATVLVPLAIREHVIAGGGEPEHRQVTVGFVHFDGTDELMVHHGPADVARRLDGLTRAVQKAAADQGVTVLSSDVDHDGGKFILVAGAPTGVEDPDGAMLRALSALFAGFDGLAIRAGVHRGHVYTGSIGPPYRRTYTVMGDAVNTAARVMSRAEPGEMLATPEVLAASRTLFAAEAVAPFVVKGKAKALHASRVGQTLGTRSSRRLPLAGRRHELEILREAVVSAERGEGHVVEIVGEPGQGKSRLVEEVRDAAAGVTWLASAGAPYEASTPYFLFRRLLREAVGEADDTRATADRLRQRIVQADPSLVPWLPLLGAVLDLDLGTSAEVDALAASARRPRLNRLLADVLRVLVPAPTLLMLEDVHWLDDASSEAATHVLGPGRPPGWSAIVTRRPTGPTIVAPEARQIVLAPLAADDAAELARAAIGGRLLPRIARAIAERSGGNPLFVTEMMNALSSPDDVARLPDSVEAVVASRIDRLPPDHRRMLRELSVLGNRFDRASLRVVGIGERQIDSLRDFVRREKGGYRFEHALFHQVAYEGLPYRRRRQLHQSAGEFLEERRRTDDVELLSLHFHEAQDAARSWRYSLDAAKRAADKAANSEAATFYRRALDAGQRLPDLPSEVRGRTWAALGEAYELSSRYADATRAYAAARRSTSDPRSGIELFLLEGRARANLGLPAIAARWFRRGLRAAELLAEPAGDLRARLNASLADVLRDQGKFPLAVEVGIASIALAESVNDDDLIAQTCGGLALSYGLLGDRRAVALGERAVQAARDAGNRAIEAATLNDLGSYSQHLDGDWQLAAKRFAESGRAFEALGYAVAQAIAQSNSAEILSDQGHLEPARAGLTEAVGTAQAVGSWATPYIVSNLGRLAARRGDVEEARDLLRQAIEGLRAAGASLDDTRAWLLEAEVLAGCPNAALAIADELSDVTPPRQPLVLRMRGYAALQCHDVAAAESLFAEGLAMAREQGQPYEIALTLEAIGRARQAAGEQPSPEYHAEMTEIFERLGVVWTPEVPLKAVGL